MGGTEWSTDGKGGGSKKMGKGGEYSSWKLVVNSFFSSPPRTALTFLLFVLFLFFFYFLVVERSELRWDE